MRRTVRGVFWFAFLVLAVVAAGTLIPRPLFSAESDAETGGETRRILLLSNAIHTDIAVRARPDILRRFAFLSDGELDLSNPNIRWIVVGWGGRAFYTETPTWSDLKPGPLFRALTLDNSVMHVEIAGEIDEAHPAVTPLDVTPEAFENLVESITASFVLDDGGQPVLLAGTGYGPADSFYEANGRFNAFRGCNIWTARMLRRAGIRTGFWTPLPFLLSLSIDLHNRRFAD